jgi:hypothetical protein
MNAVRRLGLITLAAYFLCGSPIALVAAQAPDSQDRTSTRAQIEAMYEEWGRARVQVDRQTIEKILHQEFFVLLDGEEMTRAEFIDEVTRDNRRAALVRFDAQVMTLQENDKDWTVVISEKLEYDVIDADGVTQKIYSFWVTRDGCRKTASQWQVTYSEAIGYETWRSGTKPPFSDW